MGKHIGEGAAAELEKSGARFARSGRLLSNVFTQNSAAALGPLQEVADKVELIGRTLESTKTRAGGMLLGVGAAATGVGAFLSTLASREQGATNRLAASIAASGGSIDDYRDRIDAAVKAGERFGQSGNQTIDAIQALTIGLHDPKKALDELGLAEDIAAAKQIPLSAAANLVRQAYNGNTRVLKAFGIQIADVVDGQKLLADAQATAVKAASDVTKAQQDYSNKLLIYQDTLKPTLTQAIALTTAHDKLVTATAAQADAQKGLTDAQDRANAAGSKGQEVLDKLAQITAGQASASADTFTGHLKSIGAAIENNAAKIGGQAGTALIEFGPALAAAGFLIESGLLPKIGRGVLSLIGLGGQATATAVEMDAAAATEDASLATVVAAIRELQVALSGVGPAAAVAAGEVGAAAVTMDAEIATTTAAAGRLGLVFKGLLGSAALLAGFVFEKSGSKNRIDDAYKKGKFAGSGFAPPPPKASDLTIDYGGKPRIDPDTGKRMPSANEAHAAAAGAAAAASAAKKAAAKKKSDAETLASVNAQLKALGLDPIASSELNKALADAQKAAGDRAKAIGKEVTDGLNDQLDAVRKHASAVNDQLKTIIDFRGQVVSSASSFMALSGLLPDNSLATSGGLVRSLHSRVGAEALLSKNIKSLTARHLDPAVISEILAEGPERARALAAALAAGPDSDIRQLNLDEKAGRQQAQILGQQGVDAKFGAGTQARANAELIRLNAQIARLNKQIELEPALIAKAVDQAQKNAKVTAKTASRTAVTR